MGGRALGMQITLKTPTGIFALVVAAGASHAADSATCNFVPGRVIGSGSLASVAAADAADCCNKCYDYPGCIAFTFADNTAECYLKDNIYSDDQHANHTSGTYQSKTVATRACHTAGHTDYPFCNTTLSLDERVRDLIGRLRPDEKAPLLTARESPLGGVPRLGLPEYDWGTNCIHGAQTRCRGKCPTSFPNPNGQGAMWNRTLWREMAHVTAVELRAFWRADVGENHVDSTPHAGLDCWSPNINIARDPRWGRNLETPGEDPYLNGQYGKHHTIGLQTGEDKRFLLAVVTLKHWDAYSLEDDGGKSGITRHNFDAVVSKRDLAGTYFPAFKTSVVEGDAQGVMCSYNAVNGVPSCASKFLLQDVLRDTWGFKGYITSDSGAVEDIYAQHHYLNMSAAEGVAAAIKAGCDIDSSLDKGHSSTGSPYTWSLKDALKTGLVQESEVDERLFFSLRMRFALGLFDPIEDQPFWHYKIESSVDTLNSQKLNLQATRSSIVLLKNQNRALPLVAPVDGNKVAVLGPHANAQRALVGNYLGQICAESQSSFACVTSPADGIADQIGGKVHAVEGCGVDSAKAADGSSVHQAVAAALDKNVTAVVLMVGLDTTSVEREGHDRTELDLPIYQQELIQAVAQAVGGTKPVILVLLNGGAVSLDWAKTSDHIDGIIEAFYPSVLGAQVIAETLFGKNNPGGKMPYSVLPASFVNTTKFEDMAMTAGEGRTYRFYTGTPLWDFGFGLSFTEFAMTTPSSSIVLGTGFAAAEAATITVQVQNVGNVSGDEVVQAYWSPQKDVVLQHPTALPRKQLFGFERITLHPGEAQTMQLTVLCEHVGITDALGNLVSAPGTYELRFTNGVVPSLDPATGQMSVVKLILEGKEKMLVPFPTEN